MAFTDDDGDGLVDTAELKLFLEHARKNGLLKKELPPDMLSAEFLMNKYDNNANGQLEAHEFSKLRADIMELDPIDALREELMPRLITLERQNKRFEEALNPRFTRIERRGEQLEAQLEEVLTLLRGRAAGAACGGPATALPAPPRAAADLPTDEPSADGSPPELADGVIRQS